MECQIIHFIYLFFKDYVKTQLAEFLPYIFGIAVAGVHAKFFVYHFKESRLESIKWGENEKEIFDYKYAFLLASLHLALTALSSPIDRVRIATIFINILRWVRWAMPNILHNT